MITRALGAALRSGTSTLANPSTWLHEAFAPVNTYSGKQLGTGNMMSHVDIYACVRVLADAAATCPLYVVRQTPDQVMQRLPKHPTARLLGQPAPHLTQADLVRTTVTHLNTWGNAYLAKYRDGRGNVVQLGPIRPDRVAVRLEAGEPVFRLYPSMDAPQDGGEFNRRDILHIKALSYDGIVGMSPIQACAQAIGLGMALEEYASRFFANNSVPTGAIKVPTTLGHKAAARLKADWERLHRGGRNQHRVAVLEGGAEWQAIGLPAADVQFVEQRKFSATQLARVFRVPPYMIGAGSDSSMTYSNVEQENLHFIMHSVGPWLNVIEQAVSADPDLFGTSPAMAYFDMDAFLRGDATTRANVNALALGAKKNVPWKTVNEVRMLEGLPPIEGGDVLPAPPSANDTAPAEGNPPQGAEPGMPADGLPSD